MPTYTERVRHLDLWVAELGGHRERASITAGDIRAVLQQWRASGLEPATCNKRRTALMHLWSVLDGKGASNPVRDVRKFRTADPLPRGRDLHVIDVALKSRPHSRTRACCRVMLWTGMRPVELARAHPDDVDLTAQTAIVRTAKGGRTRVIPLTSQAVSAWKEFDRLNCWGKMPKAAPMNRLLKKWTGLDLRVYDLRHSYGTALAMRETRLDVIGALMGHSTLELTKRYTLAALSAGAQSATRKLARKAGSRKTRKKYGRRIA
jgi:integrase/recombinase XerC